MCVYILDIVTHVLTCKMNEDGGRERDSIFHNCYLSTTRFRQCLSEGFDFIFPLAITALSPCSARDGQAWIQQRIISVDPVNWKCKRIMKNAGQFPILHANPRKNLCRTIVDNAKISQIPSHRRIFSPSTVILTLNINERRKS